MKLLRIINDFSRRRGKWQKVAGNNFDNFQEDEVDIPRYKNFRSSEIYHEWFFRDF